MNDQSLPTPAELRNLLSYDPATGKLFWKARGPLDFRGAVGHGADWKAANWNSQYAGREAMTNISGGYRQGFVFRRPVRAHRAIWAIVHGSWPNGPIDHINGDRLDNRLVNLRLATPTINARNARKSRNNTSGATGVSYVKRTGRWHAYIHSDGRRLNIGTFALKDDAVRARAAAQKALGYSPRHGV